MEQSCREWLCFVVDDSSTDATPERVTRHEDGRIRLLRQTHAGVSAARNLGLAKCTAPYVMFLDGDDFLHPEALARLSEALDAYPGAVAAFGSVVAVDEDGQRLPAQKPLKLARYPSGDVLERMVVENFLANGGQTLVRTSAARAVGGFDPALSLSEDWEFWCRLALKGPFVFIGPEPAVLHLRHRAGSASNALSARWANHQASIDKVAGNREVRDRIGPRRWRRVRTTMLASHLWEAGRVNFTLRRYDDARRLMLRSLRLHPAPKRLALFVIAQLSHITNRSLVSRLRFRDDAVTDTRLASDRTRPETPPPNGDSARR